MSAAWKVLIDSGLPLGAGRAPPTRAVPEAKLRRAVLTLVRSPKLAPVDRETLAAYLAAFQQHFSHRFAEVFGEDGPNFTSMVRDAILDVNRYLKLRRIAVENLARIY